MKMNKAFTLMEVNLAILVMAGGILSIVGLYSLGFRESRQSREDVAGAAYADAVISPLVMAASATNLSWNTFNAVDNYPSDKGWEAYFDNNGTVRAKQAQSLAENAFKSAMSALNASAAGLSTSWPSDAIPQMNGSDSGTKLKAGLVVLHEPDSAIIRIGFRAAQNANELMAQPLYYTEVRFQGRVENNTGETE